MAAIPAMVLRRARGARSAIPASTTVATIVTLIGVSVPNFFLATLFVLLFSYWLKWLPPVGFRPFLGRSGRRT